MKLENRLEMFMQSRGISTIKSAMKRWFVINYGPPASGKSVVKRNDRIMDLLNTRFSDIDVDTIVADLYVKRGGDVSDLTQREYWRLREEADEESDNILINSILDRNNVVWETTGRDSAWIKYVIQFVKQYGYDVLLVIPMVYLDKEVQRCTARKQPANCTIAYLSDIRRQSYDNFESISAMADRTLVFDNNERLSLVYDSTRAECGDLSAVLSDPNPTDLHSFVVKKCKKRIGSE